MDGFPGEYADGSRHLKNMSGTVIGSVVYSTGACLVTFSTGTTGSVWATYQYT
jgi:hypothetical protein